jgi:hypothetical protein
MSIEIFAVQAGSESAEITRRAIYSPMLKRGATIGSVKGGVLATGDLAVSAGSLLTVNVAAGEAIIPQGNVTYGAGYYLRNTASVNVALAAANGTFPRVDTIVAKIEDATYAGTGNQGVIEVLTGTATSGATLANKSGAATVAGASLAIGYVLVPAGSTSVTSGNIENPNIVCLPGLERYIEGTASSRAAYGVPGRVFYATDTGQWSIDTGSSWTELSAVPTAWSALTLGTSIRVSTALTKTTGTPAVRLEANGTIARLRGIVESTASVSTLFTLASSYRPTVEQTLPVILYKSGSYSASTMYVKSTGAVEYREAQNGGAILLDGVTFPIV